MRTSTTFEAELLDILEASLEHAGYHIVKLRLRDGQRKGASKSLELMAERLDGTPMSVADCTAITNTASALLDVKDPIEGAYDLEVASPGLERPLTVLGDFETYIDSEVAIELTIAQEGRKRFKGKIAGVKGEQITVNQDGKSVEITFNQIKSAALVATDEMIQKLLKEAS